MKAIWRRIIWSDVALAIAAVAMAILFEVIVNHG